VPAVTPVRRPEIQATPRDSLPPEAETETEPEAETETEPETTLARPLYWTVLACCAVLLQVILFSNSGYSWHFFAEAAQLLIGQHPTGMDLPGGLHLYANYPDLQFGPFTVLVTVALQPFSDGGWFIVTWFMTICGLVVLYLVERTVRVLRPDIDITSRAMALTMIVGGGSFIVSWELLAVHFGHLDDVLALTFLAFAVAAVVYRSPMLAGLFLGLAVDSKPWALVCAALLLVFPMRLLWRGLLVTAVVVGVAWLPFVLADSHTLSAAASFTIPNVPASALHALGVNAQNTPSWDREAQIGVGCVLGLIALIRRRWEAVFALGIGARIALDPSVYTYYTAGLALGLLLWDLVGYRKPVPLLSVLCFLGLTLALTLVHDNQVLGELRLWTVLITSVLMLTLPRGPIRRTRSSVLDNVRGRLPASRRQWD
jgi:uncharacterized membrane protein